MNASLILVAFTGLIAQLIDGAMGMAFGVTSTSLLLFLAYSPAAASAVVHVVEIVTSSISGASHIRFGNVDWKALAKIAIPGAAGAFIGAMVLSNIDLTAAKPWTALILLTLGSIILYRFTRPEILGKKRRARARYLAPLGLVGGFIDSTGGGGWGPVVTTTLTASNALSPRKAIGTANTAEFVVAMAASIGFLIGIGSEQIPWDAVVALVIGGAIGAPFAAWLVKKAPQRLLGALVGNLIVFLNIRQLVISLQVDETISVLLFALDGLLVIASLWKVVNYMKKDAAHHKSHHGAAKNTAKKAK